MSMLNPYQTYQQNQVHTASPGELTLMLFQGAVRFLKMAIQAHEEKDWPSYNQRLQRVQDIYYELLSTLDMEQEISSQLQQMYQFIIQHLIEANIRQDLQKVQEALELSQQLRDTWQEMLQSLKAGAVNTR